MNEARNHTRKRLLGENVKDAYEHEQHIKNEETTTNIEDIESYMYVPPDGRKRTMFVLPPLEDLMLEASKARYLRMPRYDVTKYEDDPERELSVDEIFG